MYRCALRLFILLFGVSLDAVAASPLPLSSIKLPPGFEITLFASVPNARQMALGKSTLFVGSMGAGKVYAIPLQGIRAGPPRVLQGQGAPTPTHPLPPCGLGTLFPEVGTEFGPLKKLLPKDETEN